MQERARFLANIYTDIEIIGIGVTSDKYTDFYVNRNGDILHFRVYGTAGSYVITEK